MNQPKRNELFAYVHGLEKPLPEIFSMAYYFEREATDTLTDEYQIASAIVSIFERRVKEQP